MKIHDDLTYYIKKQALDAGALLAGFTKIRRVEPVIILGFSFTDTWFFKHPLSISKLLGKTSATSIHVQDVIAKTLKSQGYKAEYKTIWSLYGDFRPLAVSAGLGDWGRNGIIVNKEHGAGLLFAAIFTDAPLEITSPKARPTQDHQQHCIDCQQCISSCPAKAFENNKFHTFRCLPYAIKGCSECLKICKGRLS
ncbi:epoxyqueuosine reductase [Natronincola peptidivorans]|uniref:Epoxyqueuosine reductase n=1 Tax=Natronincola peptidivorans TaxID=426128 RepID=A0A1I0FSU2_9FIRM|nr:4Fe-4S ferredoxin [Natronincola peptidivorans]SET61286.1 epoxyqueuosine reductase [Natronincola peptidivorans]